MIAVRVHKQEVDIAKRILDNSRNRKTPDRHTNMVKFEGSFESMNRGNHDFIPCISLVLLLRGRLWLSTNSYSLYFEVVCVPFLCLTVFFFCHPSRSLLALFVFSMHCVCHSLQTLIPHWMSQKFQLFLNKDTWFFFLILYDLILPRFSHVPSMTFPVHSVEPHHGCSRYRVDNSLVFTVI